MNLSSTTGLIQAAVAAVPPTAAPDAGHRSLTFMQWLAKMFLVRPPTAYDYILTLLAFGAAVGVWVWYYRAVLLDSVKDMQTPARVRLRAGGLAAVTFLSLLLLSPTLPAGWLVVFLLAAVGAAVAFGLSALIAGGIVLVAVVLVAVWISGFFGHLFGG